MALDYRKCAEEIFSHLGGKDNIAFAAHCARACGWSSLTIPRSM
ncbi:MAG: PTS transporter subunit EIIB [Galactobacillus timonensis]|nr:PTS transporter subunit EIIB [Galactobacillus timonensis]MCI6067149.1 PTS transporter subunit EIIB [Galactobacillus timonensis]